MRLKQVVHTMTTDFYRTHHDNCDSFIQEDRLVLAVEFDVSAFYDLLEELLIVGGCQIVKPLEKGFQANQGPDALLILPNIQRLRRLVEVLEHKLLKSVALLVLESILTEA